MPNKKPQINPFAMYMREQEPLLRRRGLQFNSKKEVVDYLFPHFNALSELERTKYKNMAKMEKEAAKNDLTRKYDDRGVPLSQIAAEAQEQREKHERMVAHVSRMVHNRSGDADSLLNTRFYTMFVSLRCFTDQGKQTDFIPCEMSICEWTIADGVGRTCRYVVQPDRIPMGYQSRCRELAEKTHRIPLDFDEAEPNLPGLWIRLKNFLNPQDELEETPPVFTLGSEMDQLEGGLQWLYERSMDRLSSPFRVYPLERLLFELYRAAGEPQMETHCRDLVQKGHFDYFTELACHYHAEDDNSKFCTLAMARRHAMLLLDSVVSGFGIDVKPGRHVPQSRADAGVVVNTPMARGTERPIQFKPGRDTEPDLPTQYSLIRPAKSSFRGGDRDAPIGPDGDDAGRRWAAARPTAGADDSWTAPAPAAAAATAHPRKPASLGRSGAAAPSSSIVSCSSLWGSAAGGSTAPPSVASEAEFPSLGGLAGRSRPLSAQPRDPGSRPLAAPIIGRGRSSGRTVAERFAAWPGLRDADKAPQ